MNHPPNTKTFLYPLGRECGTTLTVKGLREALAKYPDDLPVFAEWEGVWAFVEEKSFSTAPCDKVDTAKPGESALVIDVNAY